MDEKEKEERAGGERSGEQSGEGAIPNATRGEPSPEGTQEPSPQEAARESHIESSTAAAVPVPPIQLREYFALVLAVAVSDVTLFHGGGFAGYAVLFLSAPIILFLGAPIRETRWHLNILSLFLLVLGFRLFYLGWWFGAVLGFFLVAAFALALAGHKPFIVETFLGAIESVIDGIVKVTRYGKRGQETCSKSHISIRSLIAPVCAVLIFGVIFVMANPVLRDFFRNLIERFWKEIKIFVPSVKQLLFWFFALWVTAGLLRPRFTNPFHIYKEEIDESRFSPAPAYAYAAGRNVLTSLIVLFAVYLVFEFYYLWFRKIATGFRYSEYAHEGAAWLTFALAISTFVLGAIFRGGLLLDRRIARLKKLAWVWSCENFVLAICTFHRTNIYISYNGLSRMRIVALGGISVVVVGFILVVCKVAREKSFFWLIRRQILALGITIFILFVMPVDYVVTRYNVGQIMSGNPAPTVQIVAHEIGPDGCVQLLPLLESRNQVVREGVRALLAKRQIELEIEVMTNAEKGWSYFQMASEQALRVLERNAAEWEKYFDPEARSNAFNRFNAYGRQWYD
jgi:hypothetical protein